MDSTTFRYDRAGLRASWQSWLREDMSDPLGPAWLQWLWTVLFCAAIAVGFTVFGFVVFARDGGGWTDPARWLYWYGRNLVVCLTIGVIIHGLFWVLARWMRGRIDVRRWKPWQRTLFFSGVPMAGVVLGWPLGMALAGADLRQWLAHDRGQNIVIGSLLLSLLITAGFHQFFAGKARQIDAERRASEARLRLLQGQIEPHFLFNTLANVLSLMDHDAPRAREMLQRFTDYLRASLGRLRDGDATLGSELDLVEAYLGLMQMRMEDRLRYRIEVDAALRSLPLPPLLLQPLVENAIHHGLEPQMEGGEVRVRAWCEHGRLWLEVHDNGRGLQAPPRPRSTPGAGLALANLRERLAARHGRAAGLSLEAADPGTRARLHLPLPSCSTAR